MIFLALSAVAALIAPLDFYIGTYTSPDGSKGIYRAQLDPQTGKISEPELAAETNGPSFLTLHPNGKYLYAVLEPTSGDASAYRIEKDKSLSLLNTQNAPGDAMCHLTVDPTGHWLCTAGYGSGTLAVFPIAADGSLQAYTTNFQHAGSGPNKERQEKPHLHSAYAEGKLVYACDLGTDDVLVFRNESGHLIHEAALSEKCPPGTGPRHLAFAANGKWVYANGEMGNTVSFFTRDPHTGGLKFQEAVRSLADGKEGSRYSSGEIMLHPNGKWLYVSNRGDDTITLFHLGEDGRPSVVGQFPISGLKEPRGVTIDPTGRWMVVGGQKSHEVTALPIDPASGKLGDGINKVKVFSPVCIVFSK